MDPELKNALDALGMTQKQAIDGQQKALAEFRDAVNADSVKRDAAHDAKIEKLQKELDRFEPMNDALVAIDARNKQVDEDRKAQQEQLDRIETKVNRPGALIDADQAKAKEAREAFFDLCRVGTDRMKPERKNVLTVSDDTGGGYLAPSEYVKEIIKAVVEFSPMRPLVRLMTTSAKSVQLPRRTGVFTAVWTGEVATRSETTGLAYGLEDCPVQEMTAEVYASMANLEDSAFNLENEFNMEFSEQFGVAEGLSIVSGNGVKQPEGFLTASGTNAINSLAATDITADGVIDLKYSLKTAYAKNATFVLNRKSLRSIRKLKDGEGNWLWMPGLAAGRPNSIDGDPYVEVPDMANPAASAKVMAFGDWKRAYTLVDRLAISVVRDPFTRASSGQIKFVARRRVGGQVTLAEAISVMTCSASPNT